MKSKNIVILGAGFAGMQTAKYLGTNLRESGYKVYLVDRRDFHLYTPDLYEVAVAYNKKPLKVCNVKLRETVITPIKDIIGGRHVQYLKDHILAINPHKKFVELRDHGRVNFEILVVTMGSEANYFNIPGLEQNAFTLKGVHDALKINSAIDHFFDQLHERGEIRNVMFTIGGGGATGVETALEMSKSFDKLARKYKYPRDKMKIQIVESGKTLVGFGEEGLKLLLKRCGELNVIARLNIRLVEVGQGFIEIQDLAGGRKKLASDLLIWTGGVKVNTLVAQALGNNEVCRGAVDVDRFLRSKKFSDIFAAGDNACFIPEDSENGRPLPMLAQVANDQGKLIARNILNRLADRDLAEFKVRMPIYVIPGGGKYAFVKIRDAVFGGFWVWVLRRLVDFRYVLSILPFYKAFKHWMHGNRVFSEND